ncbi:hypothetical protein ACROYT_G030106 [Oculina patagonica]
MLQVESTAKRQLTVDEVEEIQRKRIASIVGHVFQLTYAAYLDQLIHQVKVNRCNGCAFYHPSQREHSCIMMDSEDAWIYYHDEACEQIDIATVKTTVESVCSALGLKLGQTWENYLTELPKQAWTTIYLTSLELEHYDHDIKNRVLYALYYGPNRLKSNNSSRFDADEACDENAISDDPCEVECPETIIRKEEKQMDLDHVIDELQNTLKASVIERFNRSFKNKMYKYFTAKNTLTYIDVLPQLVKSYNNTYHQSIKMKPSHVTKANEAKVWDTLYGRDVQKRVRFKFQVGDRVRISKVKRIFEKSYLPNFTEEMFTIYKRFARQVPVYKLKDDAEEILDGTFYEPELQKVIKNDDVYRVEKILRKRKRNGLVEYLVRWKGYKDPKFDSWVPESDISNL